MKKRMLVILGSAALIAVMILAGVTVFAADGENGVDVIEAKVAYFGYPAITVEAGKTVSINFKVDATDLNACNNEIIIPAFNIEKKLEAGDNIVTITPTETGVFAYSCWMNMIQGSITVVEAGQGQVGVAEPDASASAGWCPMYGAGDYGNGSGYQSGNVGSCCGGRW